MTNYTLVWRYVEDSGLGVDEARLVLDAAHSLGGTGESDGITWSIVYLALAPAKWVTGPEA